MFKTLGKLFRLRPYGNDLIDGMAEIWLILAALNIASIALCDAIAWAYFGYTTTSGIAAYFTAAAAGFIVLTLVGSLDAMFIMHDRSQREADLPAAAGEKQARRRFRFRRDHVALLARIVLVVLTFTVTAPFLTQLFFARDIEANIRRHNEQRMAARRATVEAGFEARLRDLETQVAERQRDLEREIAGSGASGRYGIGPTAMAIDRDVRTLQAEIASTHDARLAELKSFDEAVSTPEVLASRYGIDLVREGPDTRARVIAEMEKSPSFVATRFTIKAFLVFMFLGLVCLKLFQPESVRIYYSAQLQAAYSRLKAGIFDHRLDPRERPGSGGMNPIRFADWYENDQEVRDVTDRLRDQTLSAIERLRAQEDAVRVLQETLRADIQRMHDELANAVKTTDDLEQQALAFRNELDGINARIAEEQQALDDFRYDDTNDLSLRDQQLLIGSRNRTLRRLADYRSAASGLASSIARVTMRIEANRAWENQLREALGSAGTEAVELTRVLQQARRRRLADILATT